MSITVTEIAQEKIRFLIGRNKDPVKGLRLIAEAQSPLKVNFRLVFIGERQDYPTDTVVPCEGFDLYIDTESKQNLGKETIIDYVEGRMGSGFKVESPRPLPEHLKGPVAQRVRAVIEEQINPSVAGHGGFITLLDVKDNVAYIQLGGGCQGCGRANVTLKQGIEVMIKEMVPEITAVYDVTDHAAGKNPYYRPSQ